MMASLKQLMQSSQCAENFIELNRPKHIVDGEEETAFSRMLSRGNHQGELRRKQPDYLRQRRIDTGRVVDDVSSMAVT